MPEIGGLVVFDQPDLSIKSRRRTLHVFDGLRSSTFTRLLGSSSIFEKATAAAKLETAIHNAGIALENAQCTTLERLTNGSAMD